MLFFLSSAGSSKKKQIMFDDDVEPILEGDIDDDIGGDLHPLHDDMIFPQEQDDFEVLDDLLLRLEDDDDDDLGPGANNDGGREVPMLLVLLPEEIED